VCAVRPRARLRIVGLDATYERLPFARADSIELIPNVPSVKPWIESAVVSVVPILTGGGTKIKILESIGYGTPVVATTVGAAGLTEVLDASTGMDVVEGSARMAARICEVLANPEPAVAAAERGAKLIAARYGWDQVVRPVAENFEAWVGAR
jgi:glycosyltransferase involved in cell wall biosynthesis